MSYFINSDEEAQCVFLTYVGKLPPIEAVAVRYEAGALLAARHWQRIVVDVTRLRSIPTAMDLFKLANGLSADLPPGARVALVVRPEQARHAKIVESVARDGGVFLTFFLDAEKAAAWVQGVRHSARTQLQPTAQ